MARAMLNSPLRMNSPTIKARSLGLSTEGLNLLTAPSEARNTIVDSFTGYHRRHIEAEFLNLMVRLAKLRSLLLRREKSVFGRALFR